MAPSNEELVAKLRGPKVPFFLVDLETRLLNPSDYPFPRGKGPVQCRVTDSEPERFEAYTSGNRSIILPHGENWFKAKAVGIPCGASQPILKAGRIHSYFLSNDRIGSGTLIWGFSRIEEAENEFRWMQRVHDIAPSPTPVGMGLLRDLSIKELKDRTALFDYLEGKDSERLLEEFAEDSRSTDAASIYSLQPTDIRVDEVLYGFISPELQNVANVRDCKDYLKWLGSSCGQNLRLLHDGNILHGTVLRYGGVLTNSHIANHLVNEDGTSVTDFHLAEPIGDRRFKEIELECLTYMMNPLESAEKIGRSRFKSRSAPVMYAFLEQLSSGYIFPEGEEYRPTSSGEELSAAFIDGVEYGYGRSKVTHVEAKLRRELLEKAVNLKHKLWKVLKLPEGMQRGHFIVWKRMKERGLSRF